MYFRIERLSFAVWIALVAFSGGTSVAQGTSPDGLWARLSDARRPDPDRGGVALAASVQQRELFRLDPQRLAKLLEEPGKIRLTLPDSAGEFTTFELERTGTLGEGTAQSLGLSSWRGRAIEDPSRTAVVTCSGDRILASVRSEQGRETIVPVAGGVHQFARRGPQRAGRCELASSKAHPARQDPIESWGGEERVLRLAVACTGEYAMERGGSRGAAAQAIAFTVDRLNEIYSVELGLRFRLAEGFEELIYLDAQRDPFTNGDPYMLIGESQRVIGRRFAEADYDIGHTLSTGAGGLAQAGAGVPGHKALGVTGTAQPYADPYDVDFFAHEIAHQLGANHTFHGTEGNCRGNHAPGSSYEPGSGSTILGYAGICASDDLQEHSDDYFHAASLGEIRAHLARHAATLPGAQAVANRAPRASAGPDFKIPRSTPFRLRARDFGDDDGDLLSFCWEQMDPGQSPSPIGSIDPRTDPLFRSFAPISVPERILPRMGFLLGRDLAPGETLPSVRRELRFRLTVRDQVVQGAGVVQDDCTVEVVEEAGPFRVLFPTGPVRAGLETIEWDPANTQAAPIGCGRVNVRLSYDDGASFRLLRAAVPNTGSCQVFLPTFGSLLQRVMVESEDGRFFAVSQRFQVLASESSISFVPAPGLTPEAAREQLLPSDWENVIWLGPDGPARHLSPGPGQAALLSEEDLLAFLRAPSSEEGRTRSVLVTGSGERMFALLGHLRGIPTEPVERAALTLSPLGQYYQGFDAKDLMLQRTISERRGAWELDPEIFARIQAVQEEARALSLEFSGR